MFIDTLDPSFRWDDIVRVSGICRANFDSAWDNFCITHHILIFLVTFPLFSDTICMTLPVVTFNQIYKKYVDDIMRFSYWLSGDRHTAKDLTSETFVRLWTSPSTIEVATVKMYLITIVRNLYLQRLQKTKKETTLEYELHDKKERIDSLVEHKSELNYVMKEIQALPEIDRTALLLFAVEGYSYQQIADYLKLSLANVKVKISRTRNILQEKR